MFDLITSRQTAFLAVVYGIYGLACTLIPPFNTLGYEFAALTGILCALTSAPFALSILSSGAFKKADSLVVYLRQFIRIVVVHSFLLLIPMAILTVNALIVPNCSMGVGAVLFVLVPYFTMLFSSALSLLVSSVVRGWLKYAFTIGILLVLLCAAPLVVFENPQLFVYNHLFGVFLGFSWDETQPQFTSLLLYRLVTLAYAIIFVMEAYVISLKGRFGELARTTRTIVISSFLLSATVIVSSFHYSDELRFTTSKAYLRSALSRAVETQHFILHYDPASVTRERVEELGEEHEFRLWQVEKLLRTGKLKRYEVFLYPNRETKRALLGTESSQIARPWAGELHLSLDAVEESIEHEIVHVVAAEFGPYVVRTPVIRCYGLTEGLAMAIEWNYGNRTLHQYAAALLAYGMLPPLENIISTGGFFGGNSSLGYVASGSFCRWVMETKGIDALKEAYRRDDVTTALGRSYEELDRSWRRFLATVPRDTPDSLAVMYAFKGPSILRKICARAITEANAQATAAYHAGLYDSALSLYRHADALQPNARAVFGQANALLKLGRYSELLHFTSKHLRDERRAHSVMPLRLWEGDAAWLSGNVSRAMRSYEELLTHRPAGWPTERARFRLAAIERSAARHLFLRVIERQLHTESESDSIAQENLRDLREAWSTDTNDTFLRTALATALSRDSSARREAIRVLSFAQSGDEWFFDSQMLLGSLSLRERDVAFARRAFHRAFQSAVREIDRLQGADQLDRCAWIEREVLRTDRR